MRAAHETRGGTTARIAFEDAVAHADAPGCQCVQRAMCQRKSGGLSAHRPRRQTVARLPERNNRLYALIRSPGPRSRPARRARPAGPRGPPGDFGRNAHPAQTARALSWRCPRSWCSRTRPRSEASRPGAGINAHEATNARGSARHQHHCLSRGFARWPGERRREGGSYDALLRGEGAIFGSRRRRVPRPSGVSALRSASRPAYVRAEHGRTMGAWTLVS